MTRLAALQQMRRTRRDDEHRLQCEVFRVLRFAGVRDLIAFAIPNGLVSNAVTVSRMKSAGLLPGVADIALVLPGGQCVFLELKAGKNSQSPEQIAFQERCRANGARYFVAAGLDEAIEVLVSIGAIRTDRVRGLRREPLREAAG